MEAGVAEDAGEGKGWNCDLFSELCELIEIKLIELNWISSDQLFTSVCSWVLASHMSAYVKYVVDKTYVLVRISSDFWLLQTSV